MEKKTYRFFVKTTDNKVLMGFKSQEMTREEADSVLKELFQKKRSGLEYFNLITEDKRTVFVNFDHILWIALESEDFDYTNI